MKFQYLVSIKIILCETKAASSQGKCWWHRTYSETEFLPLLQWECTMLLPDIFCGKLGSSFHSPETVAKRQRPRLTALPGASFLDFFLLRFFFFFWCGPFLRKSTPVFLPGKFHGQRSLVGYSQWDCRESYNWAHTYHFQSLDWIF